MPEDCHETQKLATRQRLVNYVFVTARLALNGRSTRLLLNQFAVTTTSHQHGLSKVCALYRQQLFFVYILLCPGIL